MPSTYTASDPRGYEHFIGRWSRLLADELIGFAGLDAGDRLLDLGCGTGSLALALAARPEPSAIHGIDLVAPFIAFAATRSRDARLVFSLGDATALDFPAAHFDRSLSLLALNFVTEPRRALAEMRRVTRPGGVVAAAVWDFAGGLTAQRLFWDTAAAIDPAADRARARHFSSPLTQPGGLEAAFRETGLRRVEARSLTIRMDYAGFWDYWQPFAEAQGPVGDYVRQLSPDDTKRLAALVERAYLSGGADGPRSMTATAWAAKGLT